MEGWPKAPEVLLRLEAAEWVQDRRDQNWRGVTYKASEKVEDPSLERRIWIEMGRWHRRVPHVLQGSLSDARVLRSRPHGFAGLTKRDQIVRAAVHHDLEICASIWSYQARLTRARDARGIWRTHLVGDFERQVEVVDPPGKTLSETLSSNFASMR